MKASHFSKDTQEFLRLLAKEEVKYVIVGGEAVIYYGYARLTGDIDFFYESSKENALKLFRTLEEFWSGDIPGLHSSEELMHAGIILQFGSPPNRIDLVSNIDGVTFKEVWANRTIAWIKIGDKRIPVNYIGLDELIRNKEIIKRPKDLEDLKYLLKAREEMK